MNNQTGTFCTRISPGCTNCYASVINKRFGNGLEYTVPNLENVEFFISEKILEEPLRTKKPCTIFVGDMFDLFHEAIDENLIAHVIRVICEARQHTFQVLTKRADRMSEMFNRFVKIYPDGWPIKNLWLGVSVESQKYADERIPLLLQTPAAVRFLSVEPMLEAVDLNYIGATGKTNSSIGCIPCAWKQETATTQSGPHTCHLNLPQVDWVICGGESGRGARPIHPEWAIALRDQCAGANVPFFFKQWGEWMPHPEPPDPDGTYHGGIFLLPNGQFGDQGDWWARRAQAMDRVGKNQAGALLDGREWREFPAERLVPVGA
jgi:protein gp37